MPTSALRGRGRGGGAQDLVGQQPGGPPQPAQAWGEEGMHVKSSRDEAASARQRQESALALRDDQDSEDETRRAEDGDEPASRLGRQWSSEGWDRNDASADLSRTDLLGEALYGVFPVLNALRANRRRVHVLYVLSTLDLAARKDAAAVRAVLSICERRGVQVQRTSRHELNTLTQDRPHQGLVLDCEPLSWAALDALPLARDVLRPGHPAPVWVALDEVMDPQNLGAILRSAWCLGASGVLASARNCCPLTPHVSKASAGAMEMAQVHATKSLQRTLQDAASRGWAVLGAAGEAGAADSSVSVHVLQPTILVMGNEGYGLRTNIRRVCTGLVKVHMGFGFAGALPEATDASVAAQTQGLKQQQGRQGVDSLNVSVATGILLHDLLSSSRKAAKAAAGPPATAPG